MKVDRQNTLSTSGGDQIRYELCGDRNTRTVFLVRPRITEVRDHRSHSFRRGPSKSIDHHQKLHQVLVGRRAGRLHDEDVSSAYVLADLEIELAIGKPLGTRLPEIASDLIADLFRQRAVSIS